MGATNSFNKVLAAALVLAAAVGSAKLPACAAAVQDGATPAPYLKGRTDKDPLSYCTGEEIVFKVTLHGASSFPEGVVATWRRTGDDGVEESGLWTGRAR